MARYTTVNTISYPPPPKTYADPACVIPNYCKLTPEEKALADLDAKRIFDDYNTVYIPGFSSETAKPPGYDCNNKVTLSAGEAELYELTSVLCPINRQSQSSNLPPASEFDCGGNCYSVFSSTDTVNPNGYRVTVSATFELWSAPALNGADYGTKVGDYTFTFDSVTSPKGSGSTWTSPFLPSPVRVQQTRIQGGAGQPLSTCNQSVTGGDALGTAKSIPELLLSYPQYSGTDLNTVLVGLYPTQVPCYASTITFPRWKLISINSVAFDGQGATPDIPCEKPGFNDNVQYRLSLTTYVRPYGLGGDYVEGVSDPKEWTQLSLAFNNQALFGSFGGTRWIAGTTPGTWTLQYFARPSQNATAVWITVPTEVDQPARKYVVPYLAARQGTSTVVPIDEVGDPNFAACKGGTGDGGSGSTIVYRDNEKITSNWSGTNTLNVDRGTGDVVVSQAYQAQYHSPMLVAGTLSNLKRMKHLYVHLWNPPGETIDSPGRTIRDVNATVITDYGYDDFSGASMDTYGVNREIFQTEEELKLADKQNNPYLLLKVPLQGSAYGYQVALWSVDERSWALDSFQFEFDAYDVYRQKHRSD